MPEKEYRFHPIAECFPMMEEAELTDLAADIKKNGIQVPPVLYDDMILDGRNRYKAAKLAGVKVTQFDLYDGDDPKDYVISLNVQRRHLTTGQRAMIAEKLANLKFRRSKPEVSPEPTKTTAQKKAEAEKSQTEAAASLKVSRGSVQKARTVRQKATPAVVKAVERGTMSLGAAERTIRPAAKPESDDGSDGQHMQEAIKLAKECSQHLLSIKDGDKQTRTLKIVWKAFHDINRMVNRREGIAG